MAQPARRAYPGNTLIGARHGRVLALIGASNVKGADEGSFGANPYELRPGVTFWNDGELKTDYLYPHGPEVGVVETLFASNPSLVNGLTIVKRTHPGTGTQNWIDTYAAETIADCVAIGVTPNILAMTVTNPDLNSLGAGAVKESDHKKLFNIFRKAWGYDLAIILDGPLNEDLVDSPGAPAARLSSRKICGALGNPPGELTGTMYWSDAHEDQAHLQVTHRNHDAMMLFGARIANATGFQSLLS